MKFCPPIAILVGIYDLMRLKTFLKKIEQKEAEEAMKHGRSLGDRTEVFEALGIND
jgi:hypothetical protein